MRQRDGIRYTYDAQGRLKQVFEGTELIADYRYNSLGQRTVKQAYVGGSVVTTWTYLYGQAGELLGYSQYGAAGNKVKSQYIVWLDRMPLAALDIAYASDGVSISSLKKLYLHSDHLNTPRLDTNDAQEPQWRWDSDAFGVGVPNQDVDGDGVAVDIALRFPGQLYDEHSRLYYNYFRDYDPNTGRYVESDPIGLQGGLNTYGYVLGNPLGYSDPHGLKVVWDENAPEIWKLKKAYEDMKETCRGSEIARQLEDRPEEYLITTMGEDGRPMNNMAYYNGPERAIRIDPNFNLYVDTTEGRQQVDLTTTMAHEVGHAGTKEFDEMNNIHQNENPVRHELGLPNRTSYNAYKNP